MPTFTLEQLSNATGWAVALLLALSVIGLLLTSRLVPGSVSEAQKARSDAQDKVIAELVPMIRDILQAGKVSAVQQDFLVDFVKDTLRDRRRDANGRG